MKEFDKEWWPLVSNIWVRYSYKNNVNSNFWKVFICWFNKHVKSSIRKEEIPYEKCRVIRIWPANLCCAKIKIQRYTSEQKVRIEQFKDSPNHSHSLEEIGRLKCPQIVQDLVIQETQKNYRPPEIASTIKEYATKHLDFRESVKELTRKEVTNVTYKVRRSLNIYLIGNFNQRIDI
jgi:hypothetical protein